MKELELKYGCNPNQKPSRIYMEDGRELPIKVLSRQTRIHQFSGRLQRLAAGQGTESRPRDFRRQRPLSMFPRRERLWAFR